jgi:hypothetical protein
MASSKVVIWNMALSYLGQGTLIAGEDEESQEASVCRLFWDDTLDEALRDFDWPFARKYKALELDEEISDDEDHPAYSDWPFAYKYPNDCVMLRRIVSEVARNETLKEQVKFELATKDSDAGKQLIYTDQENAIGKYTMRQTDTRKYPADFVKAVAFLLASNIAPRVVKSSSSKTAEDMLKKYSWAVDKASNNSANEEVYDDEPDAEMINART